jgi:hypothetical protein
MTKRKASKRKDIKFNFTCGGCGKVLAGVVMVAGDALTAEIDEGVVFVHPTDDTELLVMCWDCDEKGE